MYISSRMPICCSVLNIVHVFPGLFSRANFFQYYTCSPWCLLDIVYLIFRFTLLRAVWSYCIKSPGVATFLPELVLPLKRDIDYYIIIFIIYFILFNTKLFFAGYLPVAYGSASSGAQSTKTRPWWKTGSLPCLPRASQGTLSYVVEACSPFPYIKLCFL